MPNVTSPSSKPSNPSVDAVFKNGGGQAPTDPLANLQNCIAHIRISKLKPKDTSDGYCKDAAKIDGQKPAKS